MTATEGSASDRRFLGFNSQSSPMTIGGGEGGGGIEGEGVVPSDCECVGGGDDDEEAEEKDEEEEDGEL